MTPEQTSLPLIDLAIIALYILGVVAFGSVFMRKSRTVEGFTVGGRSLPGWALGISIMGTFLSSITFIGTPGKSYSFNWSSYVFTLTIPLVCLIAARYFIPLYRSRLQTTAYEHLEERFGPWARAYSALSLILLQIGRIAVVLYLIALAISCLLGWKIWAIIIVLGALTIVYTVLGGMAAVVWTDVVQSIVLILGALLCTLLLVTGMPEGASQIFQIAEEQEKFSFGGWRFDLALEGFWVVLLYGMVENIKNFGVDQNYVQRFLSAKSDREARKALWLGALLYVPISAMFFFIGTALFAYYNAAPAYPEGFPMEGGQVLGDKVFPYFIAHELPVGLKGLIIAAILAAGMSTLDSSINVSATVWAVDFYKRYIRPDCGDRRMLGIIRVATIIIGAIGTGSGLLMIGAKSALDVWWQISAIFGGGMLGLFLLGILVPRATARGAALGIVAGVVVIAWGTFSDGFPFHKFLIGFSGTFAILLVGWLDSLFAPARATSV